ncbi:hypothetical protein CRG98_027849 [Punica granatum]|uniref:Uncharacterized protein n=1 Tax=Punica granatum TaxID=22663 RepID=A0A2I0J6D2_PUNGR|nr:hypothetical protein CRG98_027849 [Punica granatum]
MWNRRNESHNSSIPPKRCFKGLKYTFQVHRGLISTNRDHSGLWNAQVRIVLSSEQCTRHCTLASVTERPTPITTLVTARPRAHAVCVCAPVRPTHPLHACACTSGRPLMTSAPACARPRVPACSSACLNA